MKKYSIPVSVCILSLLLTACGPEKTPDETQKQPVQPVVTKPHVTAPEFDADSAYDFIKVQADMGPRTPGSKAHDAAVAYYEKELKRYGAEVKTQSANVQSFDGKLWFLKNVIGSFNPKAENRILLCSHYDSRPFADRDKDPANRSKPVPGVNDGASGVGVLLEVARNLAAKKPDVGVDIVFFDLEDYGKPHGGMEDQDTWCLGSQYWSKNPHTPFYSAKFGVLLDMVGASNAIFPREGLSTFYAGDVVNKIWGTAQKLGYGQYFINDECQEMTDDHAPINKLAQIPCVDIIHYNEQQGDFFEHHHQVSDDITTIDKKTLKAVGQTLLEVIYNE
ncbi:MAG: M28 family peptidase [Bacteroidetes bacterium]|nr:M28 family peptidase [Bacteroidota bacterium]